MVTRLVNTQNAKCDPSALHFGVPARHNWRMAKQPHYIKEWRKHRGLTQEQLAERIGVDRTYVSKIEKFRKRYDQPFLEAAASALNCEPADLIIRNPADEAAIWSIWDQISAPDRDQALRVLQAFVKSRTGTTG